MDTFNPQLHLLAIDSDRVKIAELEKDMRERINTFLAKLKTEYSLPEISALSRHFGGWRSLEKELYALIRAWLMIHKMNSTNGNYVHGGYLTFRSATLRAKSLPKINKLLKSVGLFARTDKKQPKCIYVKPITTPRKAK